MREMGSKSQAFWSGARRGIKLGAIAGIFLWFIVGCLCLGIVAFSPVAREHALADLRQESVLAAIGGFIAPILLVAVYGAVPGAIIMGVASMVRGGDSEPPAKT